MCFIPVASVPEMANPPAISIATTKDMALFPVRLPVKSIEHEVEQLVAAKEKIEEKKKIHKKLQRYRRSNVEQQRLHMLLYVSSYHFYYCFNVGYNYTRIATVLA